MPVFWPFTSMIRNLLPMHGGKRGKSKRRAAGKRARATRKRSR